MSLPHDHHYVPQFFLRNFAVDREKKKVTTVARHGSFAVWDRRSIDQIGYERDLYVHLRKGVPVSVETAINRNIEGPISMSQTWKKIVSGQTGSLDRSDKPILYALIRHLEVRNPHYFKIGTDLTNLAASSQIEVPFTDEEREMYAEFRSKANSRKAIFNVMSASLDWTEAAFRGAGLSVFRSPIPLRSSSTPVLAVRAPAHPALHLPLPGMTPFQLILTVNETTIVTLALGDFDDAFNNTKINSDVALGFNRHFLVQFLHFPHVRHLITGRDGLVSEMTLGRFEVLEDTGAKIKFQRRG